MLVIFAARGCAGRSRVRNLRFLTPVTGPTRYSLAEDEQFQKDKRREAGYPREESADEVFLYPWRGTQSSAEPWKYPKNPLHPSGDAALIVGWILSRFFLLRRKPSALPPIGSAARH